MKSYRVKSLRSDIELPEGTWLIDKDGDWWKHVEDDFWTMCYYGTLNPRNPEDTSSRPHLEAQFGPLRNAGVQDVQRMVQGVYE